MEPKSTILIVDDEPFGRKTLGILLNDPHYTLAYASNGAEALAKALELTPDLILLDVMMPDMNGFEVCRRLRTDIQLAEVPVIMVTALDDRSSRLQGIDAGADDLVAKPFDPVELTTRVRTITRLNRYRRLLTERAKFERLTELAPDGIILVDTAGTIQLVNPAFLHMLGVPNEQTLLGTDIHTLIPPEHSNEGTAWLCSLQTNFTEVARVETVFQRMDGKPFPVEVNAGHAIWDDAPAFQIIVRDITERKQAEEALRESEKHLRRSRDVLRGLFDGLDDSLLLLDSDGKILTINQALSTLLGYQPYQLVGESWQDICSQTAFPAHSALKTLQDNRARRNREHFTRPGIPPRVLDFQTLPLLGPEQTIDQVIVHIVDVTERLQVETLAIQNEHFAARGRMAASIAHEVNTPLQSIQNCLYLAEKATDTQRATYLKLAREELDRISGIVRQLLNVPHDSEDQPPMLINLNDMLERTLLLTGGTLANHGIDLVTHLFPNIPPIQGYADHLTQVFLNIILNAVEVMPDGGKLIISTNIADQQYPPEVTHDLSSYPGHIVIAIADTGSGIPPEIQARIFDPFFTTKTKGSGVGLAISQRIITQHKGYIKVHSTVGQGTTFHILLPFQQ